MNLDAICKMTTNAEVLNALHACRPGHPLNNAHSWYNAYFLAAQRPSHEISFAAVNWLKEKTYDDGLDSDGYPIGSPREWSDDELRELRRREYACDNYGRDI